MSKTVAIYVRVSTGKQADRDSIPFQIQECSNYVKHFLKTENFEGCWALRQEHSPSGVSEND